MPRYTVQHRYTAYRDGQLFGPWEPGTEVELDEPDAEWVNRDSAGTLEQVDQGDTAEPEPEPEPAPAAPAPEPGTEDELDEPEPTAPPRPRGRGRR